MNMITRIAKERAMAGDEECHRLVQAASLPSVRSITSVVYIYMRREGCKFTACLAPARKIPFDGELRRLPWSKSSTLGQHLDKNFFLTIVTAGD